jgi:hypothetical protein
MKRRQLGKAVGSSMKQSAVAITNPEGAYEQFKRLMAYVNKDTSL